MSYPVTFLEIALSEADEKARFLAEERKGYGHKFFDLLEETRLGTSENPRLYPTTTERPDLRVATMPKPFNKNYRLYYHFDGKRADIVCVFHVKQNPEIWQNR